MAAVTGRRVIATRRKVSDLNTCEATSSECVVAENESERGKRTGATEQQNEELK